jgi:hypothetical protein
MFALIFQRLLLEAVFDIVYFPLWWYTKGLGHAAQWSLGVFKNGNASLGPGLWLKNIFVPMYGQNDWQGRLVSFFMRLINVIGRSIALFFWMLFSITLFLLWLILPVAMVGSIIMSISN